jgi:hypothetical protein
MEEEKLFTCVENDHFKNLIYSLRSLSSTTLNAYTCDLTAASATDRISDTEQQPATKQQHQSDRRRKHRNASMIQVQGISAYAAAGRKARHHERFHSTGINVRVPFERIEKPPPLRPEQTLRRYKYDLEYVYNSLEEAKEARIAAEQKEIVQNRISADKLERIQLEGELLRKQSEREVVRQRVLTLAQRKQKERTMDEGSTSAVELDVYDTRQDELYETWNRRNSAVMKKKSEKHPEKNADRHGVLESFYKQVRRSSISHGTNVATSMRDRLDAYTLLGVAEKPVKEEKVATVSDVFRR